MDWISIKDRLPDIDEQVLVYLDNGEYCLAQLKEQGVPVWIVKYYDYSGMPTYWMPLPELPKEE